MEHNQRMQELRELLRLKVLEINKIDKVKELVKYDEARVEFNELMIELGDYMIISAADLAKGFDDLLNR